MHYNFFFSSILGWLSCLFSTKYPIPRALFTMDNQSAPPPPNHHPQFWIIGVFIAFVGFTILFRLARAKRPRQSVAVTFSKSPRQVESGLNRVLIIDQPPAYTQSPPPPVYPAATHAHTHHHHHHHTDTAHHFFMTSTNHTASHH